MPWAARSARCSIRVRAGMPDAAASGPMLKKQRRQPEQNLLVPACAYLQRSRGKTTASSSFVEAQLESGTARLTPRRGVAPRQLGSCARPLIVAEAAKLQGDIPAGAGPDARAMTRRSMQPDPCLGAASPSSKPPPIEAAAIPRSHEELVEAWLRRRARAAPGRRMIPPLPSRSGIHRAPRERVPQPQHIPYAVMYAYFFVPFTR